MLIDLSELTLHEGKSKNISADIEMECLDTKYHSYRIIDKKPVNFEFINLGKKKILINADIELSLLMPCDRCLQDVKIDFKLNISKEIDMNESDLDRVKALDESNFIESTFLNVEKFVYSEILLELPMKVLCSDNCKGICNRCGANLNSNDCDCNTTELDPRMSKILDVFNEYKEV
jgi:uncharacterized protein